MSANFSTDRGLALTVGITKPGCRLRVIRANELRLHYRREPTNAGTAADAHRARARNAAHSRDTNNAVDTDSRGRNRRAVAEPPAPHRNSHKRAPGAPEDRCRPAAAADSRSAPDS